MSAPNPFRDSLSYLWASRAQAAAALLGMLVGSCCAVAGPWVTRWVIDDGIVSGRMPAVFLFSAIILAIEGLRYSADYFQAIYSRKLALKTTFALRMELFRHLQRISPCSYEGRLLGQATSQLVGDTAAIGDALSAGFIGVVRDAIVVLGAAAILGSMHPKIGLIALLGAIATAVPGVLLRRSAERVARASVGAQAAAQETFEENIAGRRIIQLFGAEADRNERFRQDNQALVRSSLSSLRLRSMMDGGATITSALALIVVLGAGGSQLSGGGISVGILVSIVQYVPHLLGAVSGLTSNAMTFLSGLAAGERVFGTLGLPCGVQSPRGATALGLAKGDVAVSNVRFGYGKGGEVLRGVSFFICAGERVALVGRTGAGKTTLARLMARLYDPWQGIICLDGVDLRSISPSDLRHRVAYLTQDFFIFSDTVLENIRLGDPAISSDAVAAACRSIHADQFIERLPGGYDCVLPERGLNLSTGERQLLCFARVLVRNPAVLIMDEATSSVDPVTEGYILEALERIAAGRTTITIAHRLSTIRKAGRVFLVERGTVIEADVGAKSWLQGESAESTRYSGPGVA